MDGDPLKNLTAFESVIRAMHDNNLNYFAINHQVDRCPSCGDTSIIDGHICPICGYNELYDEQKIHVNIDKDLCPCE
jgi:ribonucleoside-triphosphate reductase